MQHSTDQHWEELMQTIGTVAAKHFSQQPKPKDPAYVSQMQERLQLLKHRRRLRQQLSECAGESESQYLTNRIQFLTMGINGISNRLATQRRQQWRAWQAQLNQQLAEAWHARDLITCHKLTRMIAAKGKGVRKRVFNTVRSCSPLAEEWIHCLSKTWPAGWIRCNID